MEGIIYLLNQSGVALAEANQRIASLTQEIESLRAETQKAEKKDIK